jgi:hypothetical protein
VQASSSKDTKHDPDLTDWERQLAKALRFRQAGVTLEFQRVPEVSSGDITLWLVELEKLQHILADDGTASATATASSAATAANVGGDGRGGAAAVSGGGVQGVRENNRYYLNVDRRLLRLTAFVEIAFLAYMKTLDSVWRQQGVAEQGEEESKGDTDAQGRRRAQVMDSPETMAENETAASVAGVERKGSQSREPEIGTTDEGHGPASSSSGRSQRGEGRSSNTNTAVMPSSRDSAGGGGNKDSRGEEGEAIYADDAATAARRVDEDSSSSSSSGNQVRRCAECGKEGGRGCMLHSCSGCSVVLYCGRECQTRHWKTHKAFCRVLQGKKTFLGAIEKAYESNEDGVGHDSGDEGSEEEDGDEGFEAEASSRAARDACRYWGARFDAMQARRK